MHSRLLIKALVDLRAQILGWGIGMGILLVLTVTLYPSLSSTYGAMLEELPEGLLAFMGTETSIDSLSGYLELEFFTYAPIALAVFAILAGSASIVTEESQGTLDILLAQPLSRVKLIITKLTALILANIIVITVLMVMFWVTIPFVNTEVETGRILIAFVLLIPFLVAISLLSTLLSLILSNRIVAGTLMAIFLVSSYILKSLSNMVSWLESLQPVYITSYFQGSNALVSEISWPYTFGVMAIIIVSFSLTFWLFLRRDIAVQKQITFRVLGEETLGRFWLTRGYLKQYK